MKTVPPTLSESACASECAVDSSAEDLNRECFCLGVDRAALHRELEAALGRRGVPEALTESHPHLFSALPVFVSRRHIEQVASVVVAIEEVVANPRYQAAVMSWAPSIAEFDPRSPGGCLGLDFHLEPSGPRLIEINTNPGGVLLNAVLGRAQRECMPELVLPTRRGTEVESLVLQSLLNEWEMQRGSAPPGLIAIVDETPEQQYLHPEFLLFRELFRRAGLAAEICEPQALVHADGKLFLGARVVDLVYNRLTDFSFERTSNASLRAAYLAGEVALTPHPRAHALYADKRNLILLGNANFLRSIGSSRSSIEVLAAAIPRTELVTAENREILWNRRRHLFFKPAAGFGSKATYRGDKLTRRVWEEIAAGTYVAQELVVPGERYIAAASAPLKFDLRCYAYQGQALLYAARMYQGQTTNFRTPGGGFSPVLTSRESTAA